MTAADENRALRSIRSAQIAMLLSATGFLFVVLAITVALITGHRTDLERMNLAILGLTLALLALSAVLIVALYRMACPRCAERYFVRGRYPWWHNNLAQRCMNCGLKLAPRQDQPA
jgi:hypothetical protein